MRLIKIALARDTLQLPPGLATGMPVRADVAAAEPAAVRTIRSGTEMRPRIDSPPTASGKGDHGRGCAWRRGAFVGSLRTRRTQWDVDEARKRLGLCGALASGCVWREGRRGSGAWSVAPPDMDKEADHHESDHEELVKQDVRYHDAVSFHGAQGDYCTAFTCSRIIRRLRVQDPTFATTLPCPPGDTTRYENLIYKATPYGSGLLTALHG